MQPRMFDDDGEVVRGVLGSSATRLRARDGVVSSGGAAAAAAHEPPLALGASRAASTKSSDALASVALKTTIANHIRRPLVSFILASQDQLSRRAPRDHDCS